MRIRCAWQVAGFLLTFVARRVLRAGALRLAPVRWAAVGSIVLLLASTTVLAYQFLEPFSRDADVWRLLFGASTVSLLVWVMAAFLLVKVLFLSSDGLLELTHQLPVSGKERAVAFMLFEMAITVGLSCATALPVALSALLLIGPPAAVLVVTSMLAPALLAYVLLASLHVLVVRLLVAARQRPIANLVAILVVFGVVVAYSSQMNALVGRVADFGGGEVHPWPTVVAWMAARAGVPAALAAVVACLGLLSALNIALLPRQYVASSRYLRLQLPSRLSKTLTAYDWCFVRSQHFLISSVATAATAVLLLVGTQTHPLWALSLFSIGGLYLFSATAPLRAGGGPRTSSPLRTYWWLLRPQLLTMSTVAVPVLLVGALAGRTAGALSPLLAALLSAALTTCIGVVFPAERDNPMSAFVGLSVTTVLLTLVALGVGLLQLPLVGAVLGMTAVFIGYAVLGIRTDEMRRRHEGIRGGDQLGRRRGAADARPRRRLVVGVDVLDRG